MAINADTAAPTELIDQDDDRATDLNEATDDDLDAAHDNAHHPADTVDDGARSGSPPSAATRRHVLIAGTLIVASLAGLVGWLGYGGFHALRAEQRHALYLQCARQGALNLTTISYTHVDADVQRILDSSTGAFRDEFQARAQPFVDVVRQAQSSSVGTISAAGVESENENGAQVLVAVSVKTTVGNGQEPQPKSWRMRISVQRDGQEAQVNHVEFVP